MRRLRGSVSLWLLALAAAFPLATEAAGEWQSLEGIRAEVQAFLEQQTAEGYTNAPTVEVGSVDPRLRLPACTGPLEAFLPRGGRLVGHVTVGVRCAAPKAWTLYVQATVRPMAHVVVAGRALSRGVELGPDDVELQERDLSRLTGGYITDLDSVFGMKLRRSVRAGLPLNESLLQAPLAIRRGERVTILARSGELEVRMEGEATTDGAQGQVIRVRNLSSRREIEAVVVAPGLVEVRM